ncbi:MULTISPECIES: major capsid protein [unclassified Erwinia]|uniref:major capsid protein n=1 Tax=unclassified Erwinia TaxID=2622719 RepID=UPI000C1A287A|nr:MULTISPECIES: major capsid protein [unclassified Erwinia]PIJ49190.1 phage coat protein [Erwinia sp. OAMSP11]PIJ79903.1 phage coat protein [Erwinia sp. OLCASP19]PIJ81071.1 phage coat protein [Erwinia sp. OLMTSP26]PIJ93127.1 phage coat protein [Erwinia sp. OLFS4]
MATVSTRISDIFVADYYQTLAPVNSPEKTAVYDSGIITRLPALDVVAQNGQGTATVSYWQDLDADEAPNTSTDDPDQIGKVGKATQGSMRARTLFLNKGYGVADLASELANSDPMTQIRNRFGTYWTRQWQRYLIGEARGIIASNIANDNSDMVIEAGNELATAFQDAAFTAGDAADQFSAIGVHSTMMNRMVKQDLIEYLRDSTGKIILATYLGKPIFMDDSLKMANGDYLSMFFGAGAFGYGVGSPHTPTELQRKPDGGNGGGAEILWERKTYIIQPAGFSWEGEDDPNLTPSYTDMASAANWKRVFDRKQVPFAAVISPGAGS